MAKIWIKPTEPNSMGICGCQFHSGITSDTDGAVEIEVSPTKYYKIVGGEYVPATDADLLSYSQLRARDYPAIGDQLDAILKYIDAKDDAEGNLIDIIESWKTIKELYPK